MGLGVMLFITTYLERWSQEASVLADDIAFVHLLVKQLLASIE